MASCYSVEDKDRVRRQLIGLASSTTFSSAPQLVGLLTYLVESELDGTGHELNQTRIAMDVLGRSAAFDATTDSAVRVEAGRLRSRLRDYYSAEGSDDEIRFEIPKGRYSPKIHFGPAPRVAPESRGGSWDERLEVARAALSAKCSVPAGTQTLEGNVVGRTREVGELLSGLERACSGQVQVFCVTGEPGIGPWSNYSWRSCARKALVAPWPSAGVRSVWRRVRRICRFWKPSKVCFWVIGVRNVANS